MLVKINKLSFKLSKDTMDAYKNHKKYCAAGTDWLIENDPKGKYETELLEILLCNLKDDYLNAVHKMPLKSQAKLIKKVDFNSMDILKIFD